MVTKTSLAELEMPLSDKRESGLCSTSADREAVPALRQCHRRLPVPRFITDGAPLILMGYGRSAHDRSRLVTTWSPANIVWVIVDSDRPQLVTPLL